MIENATAKTDSKLKFLCLYCPQKFKDFTSLQKHYQQKHQMVCEGCGQNASSCSCRQPSNDPTWQAGYAARCKEDELAMKRCDELAKALTKELAEVRELRKELKRRGK